MMINWNSDINLPNICITTAWRNEIIIRTTINNDEKLQLVAIIPLSHIVIVGYWINEYPY